MTRTAITILTASALIAAAVAVFALNGCAGESYKVDLCGRDSLYSGVKSSYRAGSKVRIYFKEECIGTDTDYTFYLDESRINATYERGKGFRIEFEMPDHDVKLICQSVNSMMRAESGYTDFLVSWRDHRTDPSDNSWQTSEYILERVVGETDLKLTLEISYSDGSAYTYEYRVSPDVYDDYIVYIVSNGIDKWMGTYESGEDTTRIIHTDFVYDGIRQSASSFYMPEDGMNILDRLGYILRRETEADE